MEEEIRKNSFQLMSSQAQAAARAAGRAPQPAAEPTPAEDAPAVPRKAGPAAAKLIDISADDFDDDED